MVGEGTYLDSYFVFVLKSRGREGENPLREFVGGVCARKKEEAMNSFVCMICYCIMRIMHAQIILRSIVFVYSCTNSVIILSPSPTVVRIWNC